jgi:hypothetical protein
MADDIRAQRSWREDFQAEAFSAIKPYCTLPEGLLDEWDEEEWLPVEVRSLLSLLPGFCAWASIRV